MLVASQPSRIFSVTGTLTAATVASISRRAWSRSRIRAEPAGAIGDLLGGAAHIDVDDCGAFGFPRCGRPRPSSGPRSRPAARHGWRSPPLRCARAPRARHGPGRRRRSFPRPPARRPAFPPGGGTGASVMPDIGAKITRFGRRDADRCAEARPKTRRFLAPHRFAAYHLGDPHIDAHSLAILPEDASAALQKTVHAWEPAGIRCVISFRAAERAKQTRPKGAQIAWRKWRRWWWPRAQGTRAGGDLPKQFRRIGDETHAAPDAVHARRGSQGRRSCSR